MIRHLLLMTGLGGDCTDDCSGRGECHNGTCVCEIRFAGNRCDYPNIAYHAGIGGVFLLVAFVCAVQLLMCVASEYQRLKAPTFLRACRITNQKLLYFVAFLAALIRGAYFTSPDNFKEGWSSSLLSAYYPLLMSASSLIVCFWAEVFHLRDIRWERPQFLSKSFLGFVTFNIISYSLLLAEVLTTQLASPPPQDRSFYAHIFNGCYAVLLFIVVIFFLIYGVEVYFKVRGGFLGNTDPVSIRGAGDNRLSGSGDCPSTSSHEEVPQRHPVNASQLHQSRVGLVSQALMLITISGFLCSETLSEFWKTKVPVNSRNWHDVVFRVVEIGVAVWFPAVLWNCMSPSELWILNPRKLLAARLEPRTPTTSTANGSAVTSPGGAGSPETEPCLERRECWICYDSDKPDPLIEPCACTGDVSSVHHECLRRWLIESASGSGTSSPLKCKVCGVEYDVKSTTRLDWERGFNAQHWGSTAVIVTCLCVSVAGAWVVIQLFDDPYIRMLSASAALLAIYICVKFLGQNTVSAYQRAKVGALSIGSHVATISETVAVDIAKAPQAQQPATAL